MGLFGIFSKEGREQRSRVKNIRRAVDKFAQSADRFKSLEALVSDGSPEAIYGLLRRFGMMYDKTIQDEQEKEWAFEALAEKGLPILPEVERYLLAAESISWPLRLLAKITSKNPDREAGRVQELAVVERVLERHEPGYERDPTKKIQLLNHLAGLKSERAPALCIPYLTDMDEGVRYAAVEALLRQGNEEVAREPLIDHFVKDSEESRRVRLQIAEGFMEYGWSVKGQRPGFERKLPEQFSIDREGRVKKKV
jgi:hypothetical protein